MIKCLLFFIMLVNASVCVAGNNKTDQKTAISANSTTQQSTLNPLSPPATRSPQDTLFEFLDKSRKAIGIIQNIQQRAMQKDGVFYSPEDIAQGNYAEELLEQAIRTINLSDIPEANRSRVGLERALMLKEILERIPLPERDAIPDQNAVTTGDKKLQRWEIPGTEIAIVRGIKERYIDEYLFSPETVHRIPQFFAEVKQLPPVDPAMQSQYNFYDYYTSTPGRILPPKWSLWLPDWSKDELYLDQTLWQWIALGVTLLILLSISTYLIRWYLRVSHNENHTIIDLVIPLIISLLLWGAHYLIGDVFNITSDIFVLISFLLNSLTFIAASWFTYTFINWIAEKIWEKQEISANTIDASLIRTLLRLVAVVGAATVIYFGAQSLGVPIAPLLAGFGALGLAIGIGAQEYFKNVVGGLTLFLDRPVRVGELCEFEDIRGRVEEIGLRSTRIRTLENLLVIVPNSHFSTANITNISRIPSWILKSQIGLRYETTREQLQTIMEELRQYLEEAAWIERYRVNFSSLGDYSLDISIKATVATPNKEEFLKHQETFLLKTMQIVEAAGTDFAFPSQTLYLEQQE